MLSRRPFLGFYQPSVCAVAVRMIFRLPAAADGDGFRSFELENERLDVGDRMGSVAKRQILASSATAVGDTFRYLFNDRRFDEVVVG